MASALEQFVNNVRQLSAQGKAALHSGRGALSSLAIICYPAATQSLLFALSCKHTAKDDSLLIEYEKVPLKETPVLVNTKSDWLAHQIFGKD